MRLAERLQMFLKRTAHLQYPALPLPAFTLFLHPNDPSPESNYALPDSPTEANLSEALQRLREACARRDRHPRIVFVEGYALWLAPELRTNGFVESSRAPLLICTPRSLCPPPSPRGVSIAIIDQHASIQAIRTHMVVQSRGFEPLNSDTFDEDQVVRFRSNLDELRAFIAHLDGEPVAAATILPPYDGLAELVGITTLAPFRRRGIAAALTAAATHYAFANGIDTVFLVAADREAARLYSRIGFVPGDTLLTYDDRPTTPPRPVP